MGVVPKLKQVTVTTSGTPVPILTSADTTLPQNNIVSCTIQAGTNTIYVGDSTVSATASPTTGIKLVATTNDKLVVPADSKNAVDLAKVYIDASVNGSVANVLFFIRV